ncbi:MAG: FAD-dependent oxidoreductase [Candidatus Promineifilaceae bacterium]|nr:FAD-dependent oxidoreductase [Candidatus Promineifilaceae bacterium]
MEKLHVLIIGGGGTGGALAHDLILRGFRVTLVERGEVTSGTTGRHHGLVHSGGRYAVKDRESAIECIEENEVLRRIMPGSFEENDGLFVAITDEDVEYSHSFIEGCADCGIPTRRLTREQALRLEPNLNPKMRMAVQIPDATMDAMRMALRFFASAKHGGADIRPFTEVIGIRKEGNAVTGVQVTDHVHGKGYEIGADLVVNAAGPWSGKIADMVGVEVPIRPSPGVMLALRGRLCNMVVNRLAPSGDGDIIVPQRGLSVVGTTSWVVDDPDDLGLPEDHVEKMYTEGAKMIPMVRQAPFRAAWAAARPLIGPRKADADTGRELSRTFKCFDHVDEGVEGFVTITGGKATTARGMAEATADVICQKVGLEAPCRTAEEVLLPYTAYYN